MQTENVSKEQQGNDANRVLGVVLSEMCFIKRLLDKWSCKHNWKLEHERDVLCEFGRYTSYTYICQNCGKFKRWKSS